MEGRGRGLLAHRWTKGLLQALAVAVFGFVLLNATFLLDWGFQSLLKALLYPGRDLARTARWLPPLQHLLFVGLVGAASWAVLRSKLAPIYKAIFLPVPTATVLVTIGIFTYRWPPYSFALSSLLVLATLAIFARTRQPWLYYYSLLLVAAALAVMALTGAEI